ncbi:unnamed protein product [Caenorhabditis sp. 36 PRJEB53466]|nr:unnamed protein product [Caenorhabditis sp. 36 PRJEB53466]
MKCLSEYCCLRRVFEPSRNGLFPLEITLAGPSQDICRLTTTERGLTHFWFRLCAPPPKLDGLYSLNELTRHCEQKYRSTKDIDFQNGAEFWKKITPRNYQLVLILAKNNYWSLEEVKPWFRMFTTPTTACAEPAKPVCTPISPKF